MENVTEMSDRAEQYYISTKRWVSDLEFFQIETDFLRHLQQDYFIRLFEPTDVEKLKDVGNKLLKLQLDMKDAHMQCSMQLDRLSQIAENEVTEDISYLAIENNTLSDLISTLTAEYYDVKKELFKLAEGVMRENKFLLA
jgi:predicted nuclease with TOPRIM domain